MDEQGLHGFDFITSTEGLQEVRRIINSQVVLKSAITFAMAITIKFIKYGVDGSIANQVSPCFLSTNYYLNNVSTYNVKDILHSSALDIKNRFDDFVNKGSGWSVESFKYYDLHITQVNDLRGGCSKSIINPFNFLTSRKSGLINITNSDDKCLLYCIACAFTSVKTKLSYDQRSNPDHYHEFARTIKTSGCGKHIEFPIKLTSITDLEVVNRQGVYPISFRINVFRENPINHKLHLIRKSTFENGRIVNVLLVEFQQGENDYLHYILIDRPTFFKKRYVNPLCGSVSSANTIFCDSCFEHFRSATVLEKHKNICGTHTHVKVFPKEDETLHFKNHEFNYKRIFTGYADFESILEDTLSNNLLQCPQYANTIDSIDSYECEHSFTINTKKHRAISVAFVVIDRYGKMVHDFHYTGDDVMIQFIKNVLRCEDILVNTTKFNQYMMFTKEDKTNFDQTSVCYVCKNRQGTKDYSEKKFTDDDPKVRDHDHLTGKYLGAAHRSCNLNKRREKPFLSIFLHNFSGYDSHLILPFLTKSKLPEIENISIIPKSGEKFMAIKINRRITFLDSMNFLSGSLDSLFNSIKNSCQFNIIKQSSLMCKINEKTKKTQKTNIEERIKYLTQKGSFPYEWAKSVDDYSLPSLVARKEFYNSITQSHISKEKYCLAVQMWDEFEMKCMKDYMEVYCMCDTLLLAEVFETFRSESMFNFEIDPCHFISLPGFAFQAFLKITEVNLDYITDPQLFEMLSQNLRGGHSFSSQRYEESSDFKDMILQEDREKTDLRQHLLYIDANNL